MRTFALFALVLLFSTPAVASAFDRFVNPFGTCAASRVGTRPQHATIQDAVDASSPGDAIGVCPGTYTESVTVSAAKPGISLTGLGVVVVAAPHELRGLAILANDVTVERFEVGAAERAAISVMANGVTIQSNTLVSYGSVGLGLTGDRNRALNNQLIGDFSGLFLRGNRIEVAGNRVVGGFLAALHAQGLDQVSPGTVIHHNLLVGTIADGVLILEAGAATIRNNTVQGGRDTGIRVGPTAGVTIAQNLVQRGGVGIRVESSVGASIQNNTVRDNPDAGILADGTTALAIVQNLVQRNGVGIRVEDSTDCTVSFNSVSFNNDSGIGLLGIDGGTVKRNNVSRNVPPDCIWDGLGANDFAANVCATETPPGAWD